MATKSEATSTSGNDSNEVKFLILGDKGVGKSTFIKFYFHANNMHDEDEIDREEVSIFAKYNTVLKYKDTEANVAFLDIYPGSNSAERRVCYKSQDIADVDIILLCFSIGDYNTLKSVYNLWIHEVRTHFGMLIPVFLVGLKSDLRLFRPGTIGHTLLRRNKLRIVEKAEAEIIHTNYHFHGDYMESTMFDKISMDIVIRKAFAFLKEN